MKKAFCVLLALLMLPVLSINASAEELTGMTATEIGRDGALG